MRKITKCEGEGQGECCICKANGEWSLAWMCFLYRVEGHDGVYCYKHAKTLADLGEKRCY